MSDVENMGSDELADLYAQARDELAQRAEIEAEDDSPDADLNEEIREAERKGLGSKRNRDRSRAAKAEKLRRMQNRTNANGVAGGSDE